MVHAYGVKETCFDLWVRRTFWFLQRAYDAFISFCASQGPKAKTFQLFKYLSWWLNLSEFGAIGQGAHAAALCEAKQG